MGQEEKINEAFVKGKPPRALSNYPAILSPLRCGVNELLVDFLQRPSQSGRLFGKPEKL